MVEVPYILEKIVEKIVVMPQIVEVLKYVHEVIEEDSLGVVLEKDVATHEQRYKMLSKDLKINLDVLLAELRKIKNTNPNIKIQIEIIEKFLSELEQFILYPRIVQVPKERIVEKVIEKEKLVFLPTQDERSLKMELTLSLLVEQLIVEMKRIKKDQPSVNFQLEDDVKLIFFSELETGSKTVGEDFNTKLKSFSDSVYRKFQSLGSWSMDHQMMLNSFLQERFMMANLIKNANLEIEKSKNIAVKREEAFKEIQGSCNVYESHISKLRQTVFSLGLNVESTSVLDNIFKEFDSFIATRIISEPMKSLGDLQISDQRISSLLREKDAEIFRLKEKILGAEKGLRSTVEDAHSKTFEILRQENLKLKNENSELRSQRGSEELVAGWKIQIDDMRDKINNLEQEKSDLQCELKNLRNEMEVRCSFKISYDKEIGDFDKTGGELDKTRIGGASHGSSSTKKHGVPLV